jgi:hypothetical protein
MQKAQVQLREALRDILPNGEGNKETYQGMDREGVRRAFPLTRLTAAIIEVDPHGMDSMFDLSQMVAEAKRRAKRPEGNGIAEMHYSRAPTGEAPS